MHRSYRPLAIDALINKESVRVPRGEKIVSALVVDVLPHSVEEKRSLNESVAFSPAANVLLHSTRDGKFSILSLMTKGRIEGS